jgi:tRNA(His) guanylyltransferase
MKFDDLDKMMRVFETSQDLCVPEGVHIVARLDGRGFTRLTEGYRKPFDVRIKGDMIRTVEWLMKESGFRIVYGYTESDEISLLLHPREASFARKPRKLISLLAACASGRFSIDIGHPVAFDCRISQLPTDQHVIDYFRWRQEDSVRNSLTAQCHYGLLAQGLSPKASHSRLFGLGKAERLELTAELGIDFDKTPTWSRHGIGFRWVKVDSNGVERAHLECDENLLYGQAYGMWVSELLQQSTGAE